jgi:hypothetical protein
MSEVGDELVADISKGLDEHRGNRVGRFWGNLKTRAITMMVGDGASNKRKKVKF